MLCLEVRINEDNPLIAGIDHAIMLTGRVAGFVGGDEPATIHIAGMCELENQRDAQVYWSGETPLKAGDRISVRLIESDHPTPYSELKPTDSPEYLSEQREYFEAEASWKPPIEPAPRHWPNLRVVLAVEGQVAVRSGYAVSQDHYLFSFDWNQWRPEALRVYARSFSGAYARPDHHHTEWFRASLNPGVVVSATIDA